MTDVTGLVDRALRLNFRRENAAAGAAITDGGHMDSAQAKALADGLLGLSIGGWAIEKLYGYGKSAVVMAARKDGLDGAIKVFHPELIERFGKSVQLERIAREKSLIGAEHPHLVKILDGGECEKSGHLFVVMEPIPFKNLRETLTLLPSTAVATILSQVASAARFLEDRNIVHRDIKPENIAISPDFKSAILLDLGVVRPIGFSNLTDVDARPFIGTLRYSSPEFLRREEQDTLAGWRALTFYQLGGILHDMLMKKQLFDEITEPYSLLVRAVEESIPKIAAEDTRLVTLANLCLIKKPETRLELISWPDFAESSAGDGSAALETRERIKKRQKYHQSTVVPQAPVNDRAMVRRVLEDFCNRLESRIAALLNDLQCFPLRTTKSEKNIDSRRSITRVDFDSDIDLGLPMKMTLMFEGVLADFNVGVPIFKAHVSAAMYIDEPTVEQLHPTVLFASGEIEEILDNPALESQFVNSLEQAYKLQEQGLTVTPGALLRLNGEGPAHV